jgi:hypothetical protein
MCGTAAVPAKTHGAMVKILSDLKLARFPGRSIFKRILLKFVID